MQNLNNDVIQEPKLAPPGAGLPWFQLLIMRYYLGPIVAMKTSRDDSRRRFEKISQKIMQMIEPLNHEQLGRKVLIPSQVGLEDSSRYWSIAMTLEHIVIVGRAMCSVIPQLENGVTPSLVADTAKVKPIGQMSIDESIRLFKKFVQEEYPFMDKNFKSFEAPTKFMHPWFGPIQAKQWYWLLTIHTGLHLKQIQEIVKILSK